MRRLELLMGLLMGLLLALPLELLRLRRLRWRQLDLERQQTMHSLRQCDCWQLWHWAAFYYAFFCVKTPLQAQHLW